METSHAFSTTLRVRYAECDPMGVAHHSSYAVWLEIARTEMLRSLGGSYAAMEASGAFLVITKLDVRYRRPVLYDDVIEIVVRVVGGSRVKLRHEYEIRVVERGANPGPAGAVDAWSGVVCTAASTELACVDRDGRVRELPAGLGLATG